MRVGVVGYGVVGRRVVVNLASRPEVDAILLHTNGRAGSDAPKVVRADAQHRSG